MLAGVASFWLADRFVPGVEIAGGLKILIIIGVILGLINFFVKPILKIITLPLRLLTLGIFGWIINILIIAAIDVFFPELVIDGFIPLLWTTLIAFAVSFFLGVYNPKGE
jgi:putative membrane protein